MSTTTESTRRVAIIGGGITGLTAAHGLLKQGVAVQLFERGNRLGGSIRTEHEDGWMIEGGPNSLLDGEKALRELIAELGIEKDLVVANPRAKKRFLVRDGRVQAMPMSPPSLLTTKLFSWSLRGRIFTEMLEKPRARPEDVSLATLVADHFGREAVDYALNPMVGGIYAGDPEKLSAQHSFPTLWKAERGTGSIIRGMMKAGKARRAEGQPKARLVSFRRGLQTLTDALAARLPASAVRLGRGVKALLREEGRWVLRMEDGVTPPERFDAVVLALPSGALAGLEIGSAGEKPLAPLAGVEHPPVSSLFLGYRRDQVSHPLDGFGVLIPEVEKRGELGVLFSSTLFDGRAPQGHVALTVMVGGMRQPEIARLPQAELLRRVQPDLKDLLGVEGEPVYQRLSVWPTAIPQYNLGHGKYLAAMEACEAANPGLFIGGNGRDGIAVPACVVSGMRLAKAAS